MISSASSVEIYNHPKVGIHIDRGEGDVDQAEDDGFFDLLSSSWRPACEGVIVSESGVN